MIDDLLEGSGVSPHKYSPVDETIRLSLREYDREHCDYPSGLNHINLRFPNDWFLTVSLFAPGEIEGNEEYIYDVTAVHNRKGVPMAQFWFPTTATSIPADQRRDMVANCRRTRDSLQMTLPGGHDLVMRFMDQDVSITANGANTMTLMGPDVSIGGRDARIIDG